MSCRVPFAFRVTSQSYILIVKIRSLGNVLYMFTVVHSLGLGCSRWTLSVIVLSTCPLYPSDEKVLLPLRIPGRRWLGGWTLTRKSNGEHGSLGSGPGPELFLHQDCPRSPAAYPLEFLGQSSRGGLRPSCCDARRAQVWLSPSLADETVFYFVHRWFLSWT